MPVFRSPPEKCLMHVLGADVARPQVALIAFLKLVKMFWTTTPIISSYCLHYLWLIDEDGCGCLTHKHRHGRTLETNKQSSKEEQYPIPKMPTAQ